MKGSFYARITSYMRQHQFLLSSILFIGFLLLILGQMLQFQSNLTERTALEQAEQYVMVLSHTNDLYQDEVILRATESGLPAAELTDPAQLALPRPAGFSMQLGERISDSQQSFSIRLINGEASESAAGTAPADAFEQDALQALSDNADDPFYRFESTENGRVLRYAVLYAKNENVQDVLSIALPTEVAWQQGQSGLIGVGMSIASLAALVGVISALNMRRSRQMKERYEERVYERTAALTAVNHQLEKGIGERESAEKRLSAVLDTVGEGIVTVDSTLNIVMVNRAANKIWGYNPGELIDASLTTLITGEVTQFQNFIERSVSNPRDTQKTDHRLETYGIRKDETTFPVEIGIARTNIDEQQLFTLAARDVTKRKQMEDELRDERTMLAHHVESRTVELRRANTELENASKMKDEFLASMSHELRTPLNAILGLSEALLSEIYGELGERMVRPLNLIGESGLHLLDLINDILDVSKIEAGQLTLHRSNVPISMVCDASMEMVRQTAAQKGIRMRQDIAPNVKWLVADERRLKQIMVNLLSNAVKFTPDNGAVGLQVRSSPNNETLYITVVDTGIGIPESEFSRLFDPFVQVDSSLSRKFTGTGLGLALVSRLVELHGGTVDVESKVGRGSRFTVTIPWVRETEDDVAQTNQPDGRARTDYDSAELTSPPTIILEGYRPRILLAEDNEINVATIYDFLEFKGYRVTVAKDGVEAISLAQNKPDLILMDIQMPRMDGLEASRHIRANEQTADIPIVALTGLAMSGDRERCLEAGADDYLSKPFQLEQLGAILDQYLGHLTILQAESDAALQLA